MATRATKPLHSQQKSKSNKPRGLLFLPPLFIVLTLSLISAAQADQWDDKINYWRSESASLKEEDLANLERQAEYGDVRATYLLWRELRKPRYDYKNRSSATRIGSWAIQLAKNENPVGMIMLCEFHSTGNGGIAKDDDKAQSWCRKGWEQGNNSAAVLHGWQYETGKGARKDYVEAIKWYRRGAEAGNGMAMSSLGWMYRDGKGVPQDDAEAVRWFRRGVNAGNVRAKASLGAMYREGKGVPRDDAEAVKWFHMSANAGDEWAMAALGQMYQDGKSLPKDVTEALKWIRRSADAGNAWAMTELGWRYLIGKGVPQDDTEAAKWSLRGADAGDAWAMVNLGVMYRDGKGVTQDHAEAVKWFRRGIDAGNERAMTNLGAMYSDGKGVTQDEAEAVKWFRKGAEAGDTQGMSNLGVMYLNGRGGLPHDKTEAVRWLRRGADAGDGVAMTNLADAYRVGAGLAKNLQEAARWYARALQTEQHNTFTSGETGNKRARRRLDEMIAMGQITEVVLSREVAAIFKPAPRVEWLALPAVTSAENTEITVRLLDAGGGIGDVQLFINNTLVDHNASRDFGLEAPKDHTRRSFTIKLPEGSHEILIRAYAAENMGNFNELAGNLVSTWKKISKPKLHLVVIGVNEFAESKLNLKYAENDARAIYEGLIRQIGSLYDKGETHLLIGRTSTSKAAIIKAVQAAQNKAEFDDVFVFYAASHGKNYENGGYFLLTSDVAVKTSEKVKPASLNYIELRDLFSHVRSRKKFVLLDTCHAGQSIKADELMNTRALPDDEQDLMDSLKQRSGATVLMASEMAQKAFEGYQGHGIFTYAVLEAIGVKPSNNHKLGIVRSTDEIMMHVESRVPQLAREVFNAEQKTYASKAGAGFPLVRLNH